MLAGTVATFGSEKTPTKEMAAKNRTTANIAMFQTELCLFSSIILSALPTFDPIR